MKKPGFTMAEVLITIGIIGLVAALTFPILIKQYNYKITETRLKKFYTTINQAVMLAEVKYGDKTSWYEDLAGSSIDSDGNPIEGSSQAEKWFKKYLGSNLNAAGYEIDKTGRLLVHFADGSTLMQASKSTTRDWLFFPSNADKCIKQFEKLRSNAIGICLFPFNFSPQERNNEIEYKKWKHHINKGFEPWKYKWDGTVTSLWEGCRGTHTNVDDDSPSVYFCTALIQYYGWSIPKNYPKNIHY